MAENDELRWEPIKRPFKYITSVVFDEHNIFKKCSLCGELFLIDDIDKDYGCCKDCLEATEE